MIFTRTLLCWTLIVLTSSAAFAGFEANLSVNGIKGGQIIAGKPSVLEIEIVDTETGKRLNDFVAAHMKYMHLVIFREDLQTFSHFHPMYDPSTGLFQAAVHLPVLNPDNQAATSAVPENGNYFVFAEVKSKSQSQMAFRMPLSTVDPGLLNPLVIDEPNLNGFYLKYFDKEGQITLDESRAQYRTRFSFTTVAGDGGKLVRLFLTLEEKQAGRAGFEEVPQLEPWLMMGGHAILTNNRGPYKERLFGHLHSARAEEGGSVSFGYFNRGELEEEPARVWIQIKYRGKVLTIPYTFLYEEL